MEVINEIRQIISDFGGHIELDTPIVCKVTPHSKPEKIVELFSDSDFNKFSIHMIYTIRQRLRLLQYYKTKTNEK